MHDKPNDNAPEHDERFAHPLRGLTAMEFAQLGGSDVAYVREVTVEELEAMLPDVEIPATDSELQLVMSAEGRPLLIADSPEAVGEWLGGNEIQVATRH